MVAFKKAMSSVSTIDSAMVSCFLHSQEIGLPATIKTFPSVDHLVSLQLA